MRLEKTEVFDYYARNPGPDRASGTPSGSSHRRRTEDHTCPGGGLALRLSCGLHRKQRYKSSLPMKPSEPDFLDFKTILAKNFYGWNFWPRKKNLLSFSKPEKKIFLEFPTVKFFVPEIFGIENFKRDFFK